MTAQFAGLETSLQDNDAELTDALIDELGRDRHQVDDHVGAVERALERARLGHVGPAKLEPRAAAVGPSGIADDGAQLEIRLFVAQRGDEGPPDKAAGAGDGDPHR